METLRFEAGEVAQHLNMCAAHPEDPGSTPTPYSRRLITTCTSSIGHTSGLGGHSLVHMHTHTILQFLKHYGEFCSVFQVEGE